MTRPAIPRTNSAGRILVKSTKPSSLKSTKTHHRLSSTSSKSASSKRDSHIDPDDDDIMAALPSYCATCEKQIIHPNASFLYCSAACRKRDELHSSSSASLEQSFQNTTLSDDDEHEEYLPDIVPQRSPTVLRPSSITSTDSIYDKSRVDSEAARYLSLFTSPSSASPARRPRPGYYRNPASSSNMTLPSLSHTPASTASSYDSLARTAPSALAASLHHHPRAAPTRLLGRFSPPPADEASLCSSTSTLDAGPVLTYEKKPVPASPAAGSLKQLFAHDAMRRPSTAAWAGSASSVARDPR